MPVSKGIGTSKRWSLLDSYHFIAEFVQNNSGFLAQNGCRQIHSSTFSSSIISAGCQVPSRYSRSRGYIRRTVEHGKCSPGLRSFHDYFVTHLPSSSLHPDSRSAAGPHHKLPRSASTPHTSTSGPSPAAAPPMIGASRELTVVRIPLRSAKHHFGVSVSRGTRPYNEDSYQAGTLAIPAFAKRAPISLSRKGAKSTIDGTSGGGATNGDPQVFYFGVFDGHGGHECSDFLRQELHTYLEDAANLFGLRSSLQRDKQAGRGGHDEGARAEVMNDHHDDKLVDVTARSDIQIESTLAIESDQDKALGLQRALILQWKETVGGYFKRFKPAHFSLSGSENAREKDEASTSIESVLMYAFLKADLEFVIAQARKPDDHSADKPLNADEILGKPSVINPNHQIGGPKRFQGGSTASIALISTPTPSPFWHPASPSTLIVAHVGDTRILLCDTATGVAQAVTTNHHPSSPVEGSRLRRYAATFVTDSFGEERMSGLANTRAFGDMRSKRIGVSAEPEIRRVELAPAEYSFMVLISDGVSGTLTDQEIVDIVKEAKTPEQGARDVVSFATEVSKEGDNATCLVVRLGGWERRIEGGMGSMGTKEVRDFRKGDAQDPRSRRT